MIDQPKAAAFAAPAYAGFASFDPDAGVRYFCRMTVICPDTGTQPMVTAAVV